jgi:hypothetical protein
MVQDCGIHPGRRVLQKIFLIEELKDEDEESDGVSSTQTTTGSDAEEDTENATVLVQMEVEKRTIRVIPFVTTLSSVPTARQKGDGFP